LRDRERLAVNAGAVRPGDYQAMMLLRHFTNAGVTPEEYRTAMPELLQYAVKEEGGKEVGFDGDFLIVAEWLIEDTQIRMGVEDLSTSLPKEQRIALLARVYGKLELLKQTIWRDPEQAEYKKKLVKHAERMLKTRDKWGSKWGDVFAERERERSEQHPD
jgi:hypothetical protein